MSLSPLQFIAFAIMAGVLIMLTLTWLAPTPISSPKKWADHVPQWFSSETTNIKMNALGKPEHEVCAEKLVHFDQQKQTEIIQPRAKVFSPDAEPWELRADRGIATHATALEDMKQIDFYGDVIISRKANQETPLTQMTTEFLQFFPSENIVMTDVLVNFRYGQHTASSLGLKADLNTQQIELLNSVTSQYVPSDENAP